MTWGPGERETWGRGGPGEEGTVRKGDLGKMKKEIWGIK